MTAKNIAASVRARLHNHAKESGRPLQEYLQHYGLERFLFRLSKSEYGYRFILKGGLMFRVWKTASGRPTRDIDLHGITNNSISELENIVREICDIHDDDGINFDSASIEGERIKEGADYEGVRIRFLGFIGRARIPMQLDIAFGDVIHPEAIEVDYPTLLAQACPRLRVYPQETVIAEKFQAMVQLGVANSRMKDFYDIWLLSQEFSFTGSSLQLAIQKTFVNRKTGVEAQPFALTDEFAESARPSTQWTAFRRRMRIQGCPETLAYVVRDLRSFLLPIAQSLVSEELFEFHWSASARWQKKAIT